MRPGSYAERRQNSKNDNMKLALTTLCLVVVAVLACREGEWVYAVLAAIFAVLTGGLTYVSHRLLGNE
ncbi:MAG TPA: hypothetical protein VHP58_07260 [Alphaproteobacteria bacterium]|nr:hypothetical protein [Alphaproteobacteria bacterium]